MPLVYTSKGDLEPFDPIRIRDSLVVETKMSNPLATNIAQSLTRKLISANPSFLSGPMIREMVCQDLVMKGLEIDRLKYTRIGAPLYDVIKIMTSDKSTEEKNHEIALRIGKEYHNVIALIKKLEKEKEKKGL